MKNWIDLAHNLLLYVSGILRNSYWKFTAIFLWIDKMVLLMACLNGGGEGEGVEESKVELVKNKLILC